MSATPRKKLEAAHDRGYTEGRRRTILAMLSQLLGDAGAYGIKGDRDVLLARLVTEREGAIATLRSICREHDLSQDWPDDLCLSDIIEKRIVRELKR